MLISPEKWRSKLKCINSDNPLYSLVPLYVNQDNRDWMRGLNKIAHANNQNTIYVSKENQINLPIINQQILDVYFSYLEKMGFLIQN